MPQDDDASSQAPVGSAAATLDPVVDPGVTSAPPVEANDDTAAADNVPVNMAPTAGTGSMAADADGTPSTVNSPVAGTGTPVLGEDEETGGNTGTPSGSSVA